MATQSQDCMNAISMATKRLEAKGCGSFISSEADGSNSDPNAPADGSCAIYHPNGGGVKAACATPSCNIASLGSLGDTCDGIVYLGTLISGQRTYTTLTNSGKFSFNDGTVMTSTDLSAISGATGVVSTNYLDSSVVGEAPYAAAETCRAIGPEWFLPNYNELFLLSDVKASVPNLPEDDLYWSSGTFPFPNTSQMPVNLTTRNVAVRDKSLTYYVRCMRFD